MTFDSQADGHRTITSDVHNAKGRARSPKAAVALSEDDKKMIVLQSWYQRMSAERIGRHHGIPAARVRRILEQRMGGNC